MATIKYVTNDIVPHSGIYYELIPNGITLTQVRCNKGEKFPPTLSINNYYELKTISVKQVDNVYTDISNKQ